MGCRGSRRADASGVFTDGVIFEPGDVAAGDFRKSLVQRRWRRSQTGRDWGGGGKTARKDGVIESRAGPGSRERRAKCV